MSLYSFIQFGNVALPTAGVAAVTGSSMSVRVEEDEMLLVLNFQGRITAGATAQEYVLNFEVDGVAASALPLVAHTGLTGRLDENFNVSLPVTLTKGEHKITLLADAGAAGAQIDGASVNCRFSATRVSSDATLAHGVDSKVQNIF